MYKKKEFSEDRIEVLHRFINQHPLATIITHGEGGMMANLIPIFLIVDGAKGVLRLHLAKMNPQLKHLENGGEVLLVFNGPQSYITPSWYPTKKETGKVVPTWNYSMVQVRGVPKVIDDSEWILRQIKDLTIQMESGRENSWQVSDAPESYILGQLNVLSGVEISISSIEGKFKMSQNQSEENRVGVITGLDAEQKSDVRKMVEPKDK